MEKLTSILAVLDRPDDSEVVLDKAVALARCFGARIEIVLGEAARAFDVAKQITLRGYDQVSLTSLDRGGESVSEFILRRLLRSAPDLIIKAPTGAHPLRRWSLDSNDWRLANECSTPVLLTRQRPWSEPMRLAAAVDVAFEEDTVLARRILHASGYLAMGWSATLDILYSERELKEPTLRMERAVKLAQLVREFHIGCEHIRMLSGSPEITLPPLMEERRYDVLVLGAPTRRQGFSAILGGMTNRLIEATGSDVLLVKPPAQDYGERREKDRAVSGS